MAKKKAVARVALVLRWIAGLFYAAVGANGLLNLGPMREGRMPASIAFFAALHASRLRLIEK